MTFYERAPEYNCLKEKVMELKQRYSFLQLFPIGKSVLGKKIYALGLGNLQQANLMAAAFHGQEWLTTLVLIRFAEELCHAIESKELLYGINPSVYLEKKGLVLIPMVNPDGVMIGLKGWKEAGKLQRSVRKMMELSHELWQSNARGIDLNHNFDANFELCRQAEQQAGIFGPGPGKYGGTHPGSEPETRALMHFCTTFQVRCAYAFHSQGEEIYFEYGEHTPVSSSCIAALISASTGYKIAQPGGTASHGGFKDWFIDTFHRPGFTLEIGKGKNPLPIDNFSGIYQNLREALVLMSCI